MARIGMDERLSSPMMDLVVWPYFLIFRNDVLWNWMVSTTSMFERLSSPLVEIVVLLQKICEFGTKPLHFCK